LLQLCWNILFSECSIRLFYLESIDLRNYIQCIWVELKASADYFIKKYRIEGNFDGEKIVRIALQIVYGGIKFGELLRSRAPFVG